MFSARRTTPDASVAAPIAHTTAYRGGSGPALVLIHGIAASPRVWLPVLDALRPHHELYAPTLAGHNGAPSPADGWQCSISSLADAIEEELDANRIEAPHVVGNSLGGRIALELGRRGRASSIVALSPAGAWAAPRDARRLILLFEIGRRLAALSGPRSRQLLRRPRARRLALTLSLEHGDRMPAAEIHGLLDDFAACTVFDELFAAARSDGSIVAEELDRIACPVRIAWGARDRMLPFARYGQPLLDLLPDGEHVMLSGVGHVPMYDDPELVARTILEVTAPR
jgi:pimeloyl-ACP methyl ester carboxylesterase